MEIERKSHSMDEVRKPLHEFEEAVVAQAKWSITDSKVMKQQETDRAPACATPAARWCCGPADDEDGLRCTRQRPHRKTP